MACSLNTVAVFANISAVKSVLLAPDSSKYDDKSGNGKEDFEWDWPNWMKTDTVAGDPNDEDWLKSCIVAGSPVGDFMAIARASTVVFLTLKWDSHEKGEVKNKFAMTWSKTLGDEPDDVITALSCVPLASQKRSLHGLPDWTCVMIGFRSGCLKMYTEAGVLLSSHLLSLGPVLGIKCRTFGSETRSANVRQSDELVLLYDSALVVIDGCSLYYTLAAVRNQAAKATASGSAVIQDFQLTFKKWSLRECGQVLDCVYIGETSPTTFDQLVSESVRTACGGSSAASRIPVHAQFTTCGSKPYLGFYYTIENNASPLMTDISAAASALKSLVKGVFFGGKTSDPSQPKIEPGVSITSRFDILDSRRIASAITPSPDYRFSAVSDDFGRVVIFDNLTGLAVRMFKGYRDAQCGWVEEQEDVSQCQNQSMPRVALFLIIYAPRRGILEVWLMRNGPRVAAYNVGKHSRLYVPDHKMMGPVGKSESSIKQLCFLIGGNGTVKIVEVPFHCALGDEFSKHARDLHLLRNLNEALKSVTKPSDKFADEVAGYITDMKTASVRQQALDRLLALNLGHETLHRTVCGLLDQLRGQELDLESKLLLNCCFRTRQLLDAFRGIEKIASFPKDNPSASEMAIDVLSGILRIPEHEVQQLLDKVGGYCKSLPTEPPKPTVRFADEWRYSVETWVRSFETNVRHLPKEDVDYVTTKDLHVLSMKSGLTDEEVVPLGRFLYRDCLEGNVPIADVEYTLKCSGVQPEALLKAFLAYWLRTKAEDVAGRIENCHAVLNFLCDMKGDGAMAAEDDEESRWWISIGEQLSRSHNIPAALVAAVVSRGIAMSLAQQKESISRKNSREKREKESEANGEGKGTKDERKTETVDSAEASSGEWETVDMNALNMSLMVRQLEDLLAVGAFLAYRPPETFLKTTSTMTAVSLATAIEKGRGFVSEVVAQRLTTLDVDVANVIGEDRSEAKMASWMAEYRVEEAKEAANQQRELCELELQGLLAVARHHFPYSLDGNVLYANCCWDLAACWNKDPDNLRELGRSVACLSNVRDGTLRQGMAAFIWQKFLKSRFTSAVTLMEKVGKIPKDRQCRKDVGMSDMNVGKFMNCCGSVLSLLLTELKRKKLSEGREAWPWEELWQGASGPAPLVQLVSSAKRPNASLVEIHRQLAVACQVAFHFNTKPFKPMAFFRGAAKRLFFVDLHSYAPSNLLDLDEIIQEARTKFLCESIAAAVATMPEPDFTAEVPERPRRSNAGHWVDRIMSLGQDWHVAMSSLQKRYVRELYRAALDPLAEELLPVIEDRSHLASQLLEVAGHRIKSAVANSETKHVLFPPTVTDWLNSLGTSTLRFSNPPLRLTALLVNNVVNMIPDGHPKYRLAIGLVEPVQVLMETAELDASI